MTADCYVFKFLQRGVEVKQCGDGLSLEKKIPELLLRSMTLLHLQFLNALNTSSGDLMEAPPPPPPPPF